MISFIISAYGEADRMPLILSSLKLQTVQDFEVFVTDNKGSDEVKRITESYGYNYLHTDFDNCYDSAHQAVPLTKGDWLCFPANDSYYVPLFLELMLEGDKFDAEFIYCDMLYDPRLRGEYAAVDVYPAYGKIDKGGFLLKRSRFKAFPKISYRSPSDWYLVESLLAEGVRTYKAKGVLWIHN